MQKIKKLTKKKLISAHCAQFVSCSLLRDHDLGAKLPNSTTKWGCPLVPVPRSAQGGGRPRFVGSEMIYHFVRWVTLSAMRGGSLPGESFFWYLHINLGRD